MHTFDAPADLSRDARLSEIAALLARGVLRLRILPRRTLVSGEDTASVNVVADHVTLGR